MPLSDHEQKLLDEIEQALCAEDPRFASAVRSVGFRSRARRMVLLCSLGILAGLGLVLVGLVSNIIALSVVGFVLVVASCAMLVRTIRPRGGAPVADAARGSGPGRQRKPQPRSDGLRARMEQRLRRRFDEG
jgi:hypothetical protein